MDTISFKLYDIDKLGLFPRKKGSPPFNLMADALDDLMVWASNLRILDTGTIDGGVLDDIVGAFFCEGKKCAKSEKLRILDMERYKIR